MTWLSVLSLWVALAVVFVAVFAVAQLARYGVCERCEAGLATWLAHSQDRVWKLCQACAHDPDMTDPQRRQGV